MVVVLRGVIISIAIINGAKCQDHRAGKKQGSKLKALFSKKVGARQGDGGSLCQYAIRRGPMMVATGGALIRTDIEKDDLRLAAERACLFVPCGGQLVKDGKPTDVLYT